MSSNDGIPTDVIVVEGEVGDGRVPGSVCADLLEPLRLNDDIIIISKCDNATSECDAVTYGFI